MKKTLHIDAELLKEARAATGASTDAETLRLGLEALVRHASYQQLRTLRGSERGRQQAKPKPLRARLKSRERADLDGPAAKAVRAARKERDRRLSK
jgi:putative antitoxin of VapBC-like toxin-antitoxin system